MTNVTFGGKHFLTVKYGGDCVMLWEEQKTFSRNIDSTSKDINQVIVGWRPTITSIYKTHLVWSASGKQRQCFVWPPQSPGPVTPVLSRGMGQNSSKRNLIQILEIWPNTAEMNHNLLFLFWHLGNGNNPNWHKTHQRKVLNIFKKNRWMIFFPSCVTINVCNIFNTIFLFWIINRHIFWILKGFYYPPAISGQSCHFNSRSNTNTLKSLTQFFYCSLRKPGLLIKEKGFVLKIMQKTVRIIEPRV